MKDRYKRKTLLQKTLFLSLLLHAIVLAWMVPKIQESHPSPIATIELVQQNTPEVSPDSISTPKPSEETTSSLIPQDNGTTSIIKPSKTEKTTVEDLLKSEQRGGTGIVGGAHVIAADLEKPIENPPPVYPPEAIQRQSQGTVGLLAHIDPLGNPVQVEVVTSSGDSSLDHAAWNAIRQWRFNPSQENGRAIESIFPIRIQFVLDRQ